MTHELTIDKHFDATPADVYQAWANPKLLSKWMGPGTVTCEKVDAELKVGGHYEIHMLTDDGIKIAYGTYKTIEPNQTLAFTWRWKNTDMPESLVTLRFTESKGGTDMRLHHTLLPSDDSASHHTLGWNGSISKLDTFLASSP